MSLLHISFARLFSRVDVSFACLFSRWGTEIAPSSSSWAQTKIDTYRSLLHVNTSLFSCIRLFRVSLFSLRYLDRTTFQLLSTDENWYVQVSFTCEHVSFLEYVSFLVYKSLLCVSFLVEVPRSHHLPAPGTDENWYVQVSFKCEHVSFLEYVSFLVYTSLLCVSFLVEVPRSHHLPAPGTDKNWYVQVSFTFVCVSLIGLYFKLLIVEWNLVVQVSLHRSLLNVYTSLYRSLLHMYTSPAPERGVEFVQVSFTYVYVYFTYVYISFRGHMYQLLSMEWSLYRSLLHMYTSPSVICIHLSHRSFSAGTSLSYLVGRFFYRSARSHQLPAPERGVERSCTDLFYRLVRFFYRSLFTTTRLFGVSLVLLRCVDHINFQHLSAEGNSFV